MIRSNASLNCACCNSHFCHNGPDYADKRDSSGRINCRKIGSKYLASQGMVSKIALNTNMLDSVKVSDRIKREVDFYIGKIDREVIESNLLYKVFDQSKPSIALEKSASLKSRTLDLFRETEKQTYSVAKTGTVNDQDRIDSMREFEDFIKLLDWASVNKEKISNIIRGLSVILFGIPNKSLAPKNRMLIYEYRQARIRNEISMLRVNPEIIYTIEAEEKRIEEDKWYVVPNPHRNDEARKPLWASKMG